MTQKRHRDAHLLTAAHDTKVARALLGELQRRIIGLEHAIRRVREGAENRHLQVLAAFRDEQARLVQREALDREARRVMVTEIVLGMAAHLATRK